MADPRWTVEEDRYISYGGHLIFAVLADPNATPEKVAEMRAALVAAVRGAELLRQARELAQSVRLMQSQDRRREAIDQEATAEEVALIDSLKAEGRTVSAQPHAFQPDWAVHPGEVLEDELSERHMTQTALAALTGYTLKHVNQVARGHVALSADFAVAIEAAIGLPAQVMVRLQADYDVYGARRRFAGGMEADGVTHKRRPKNQPAAPDELALIETLRTETGL